ncbi:hypothetical protein SDC9_181430 [bioreactor metagenome]|uniref:Uncharacterized protein n=1 Tax=bioreactor metagenome TaxID=1076179 RepID=A0A645H4J4_9ZZZZ
MVHYRSYVLGKVAIGETGETARVGGEHSRRYDAAFYPGGGDYRQCHCEGASPEAGYVVYGDNALLSLHMDAHLLYVDKICPNRLWKVFYRLPQWSRHAVGGYSSGGGALRLQQEGQRVGADRPAVGIAVGVSEPRQRAHADGILRVRDNRYGRGS